MRRLAATLVVFGCLLTPTLAYSQTTLAGMVRDSSGAVLPGVTVEAASAVLIEKVRTAVTDNSGQYRITDLAPGTYTVTYTLQGFTKVVREGVALTGSGVTTINADLRVGALQETITVTGETPVVDVQSTRRETVINAETLRTLPITRSYGTLLAAIPGIVTDNTSRGAMTEPFMTFFTSNGGRANEGRMLIDGLPVAASFNGGGVSTFIYDVANTDEMQVLVSGGLGEAEAGGPIVNLVPRSGGNSFKGSAFYSATGNSLRSDNIDDYLRSAGIVKPPATLNLYDVSGSLGGPILRDRLWFFGTLRDFGSATLVEGANGNKFAGDASHWNYAIDPAVETRNSNRRDIYSFRFTSQLTPRNRVSFSHEYQRRCTGSTVTLNGDGSCRQREAGWIGHGTITASPESWPGYHDAPYYVTQATWQSPFSSKLLLDAGFSRFHYIWYGFGQAPPDSLRDLIPVTEQAAIDGHRANFTYRGMYDPLGFGWANNDANPNNWRASISYVTGAHNLKMGYQGSYQKSLQARDANSTLLRYLFNSSVSATNPTGALNPIGVGYTLVDRWEQNDRTETTSLFAQDQWTRGRITVQGAVRYDRAWSWAPAEGNGTTHTSPFLSAPVSFGRTASVDAYNDITTRWGAAWDIFGTGKTALRVNLGKYLQNATNDENYWANNPAGRIVRSVFNRGWTDANSNFVVDCDLRSSALQDNRASGGDLCQALGGNDVNFGNANPNLTIVNPEILRGWGVRPNDWQFGLSVQHELLPRLSVDVSYNRRWFGNFFVTDNQLVGPSDYEAFTFAAPQQADLPGGGGYPLTLYALTREAALRGARNYQTFETDYGPARTQYWHGVNLNLNARLRSGISFQGGTSTGRGVRDRCESTKNLPEEIVGAGSGVSPLSSASACAVTEPLMTSFRLAAYYTVPKIDVLVSTQIRNLNPSNIAGVGSTSATNGASLNANIAVPNAVIQQTLGRTPGTSLITQTTTINMLTPGQMYPDTRLTQVDMRFAKIVQFGSRRADLGVDLYNLFNTNDTTTFEQTFDYATNGATWLRPTAIVPPRFVRFNVTFTF
ncbi:MAG TPA: TonB-dependent receptor [Vicinamibacterales bacterium]|nr:TonB-dependent receptor [Vicinamibacterales bacterium]